MSAFNDAATLKADVPADDLPGEYIGDECDVGEALPHPHVGHVYHPEPAWCVGSEASLHQVRRALARRIRLGGEHPV